LFGNSCFRRGMCIDILMSGIWKNNFHIIALSFVCTFTTYKLLITHATMPYYYYLTIRMGIFSFSLAIQQCIAFSSFS
jgi:hypothetical protein